MTGKVSGQFVTGCVRKHEGFVLGSHPKPIRFMARMPFELLHSRLPELAERETRTVTVLVDNPSGQLPPAEYAFPRLWALDFAGKPCRTETQ